MNEQALKDAYDLFRAEGYEGSIEEFISLMQTNPEAVNDAFSIFQDEGYEDSIDDFQNLIGVKKKDPVAMASVSEDGSSVLPESPEQPTEKDYFEGTFGDILRGFDNVTQTGLGDFVDDMARSVASGYYQGVASENASDLLLAGSMASEEDIASFIEANKNTQMYGPSAEMQEYQKAYEDEGKSFWGVVKGLSKSGLTILPELIVSSLTSMATNTDSLLAGAATIGTGAAVGGGLPGAAAAVPFAFGAASSALEMGATFSELLQEELDGKDLTSENVRAVLEDPEAFNSIRNKAITRGIAIGTIDAFTGKLAGGVGAKLLTKGGKSLSAASKLDKIKSVGAAGLIEGAGGSIGEATARGLIGQEMDISEIALEGLAETPGGIKDIVSARFSKPKYRINGQRVDVEEIDNVINNFTLEQIQATKIKIDNDYSGKSKELNDRVIRLSVERELLQANPDLNKPTLEALTDLQLELNELEGNKTEPAKEKASLLRQQMKDLQAAPLQEEVEVEAGRARFSMQDDVEKVYHGSPNKIKDGVLKKGQSGAVFLTPSLTYAKQYARDTDNIVELELTQEKINNLFDLRNPEHIERLREGFINENEDLEIVYDSEADAIRDYNNAIRSMKNDSQGREGINDWASGSQFIEAMENAGFEGAVFAERPAGFAETDVVISYALFDKEINIDASSRQRRQQKGDAIIQSTEEDVDAIAEEMNAMDPEEVNFTTPEGETTVTVNPLEESTTPETITEEELTELGYETTNDLVKPISYFDGIPMITAISDMLSTGTVKDSKGNDMKVSGGLLFNVKGDNKNAAWAGVARDKSQGQYDNAVRTYQNNKELFDRLWKEGKIPDGHIPMAIIKMGNEAVHSNEASFRFFSAEINSQSKENQTEAMNDVKSIFENKPEKQRADADAVLSFINQNNITTLGQFFEAIVSDANQRSKRNKNTLSLKERAFIFDNLISPEKKEGEVKANKPFIKSLYKGGEVNQTMFTANNLYNAIGEKSMLKANKGDVVAVVGVDVKNGGVIDINHENYGTGPKGRPIALIENPTNGMEVFPTWKAKSNRVFKKNIRGKRPGDKEVAAQTMGTVANDEAFQGDVVTTEMSPLDILIGKLKFAFPNVSVTTNIEEFNNILSQPGVRTKESKGRVILGLTTDGKIYLNPEVQSLGTPIHEFGHIWLDFLRSKDSGRKGDKLLARGLKLVEGTPELTKAIEKYGDTKLAREEALVELLATKGETIANASQRSKFKEWMNAMFKYIKEKFTTTKDLKIKDINKMTLDDFINTGLADLFKGTAVSATFDAKAESTGSAVRMRKGEKSQEQRIREGLKRTDDQGKEIPRKTPTVSSAIKTFERLFTNIKDPSKITLTQRQAIATQIKLLNRGARTAKASFIKAQKVLTSQIKDMRRGGKISDAQLTAVLNRFSKVNMFNPTSIDRFVDYMAKVFADAEYAAKINFASKARRNKAKKAAQSKIGMADSIVPQLLELFSVNPTLIPDSVLDQYISLVDSFSKAEAVLSLPSISEVKRQVEKVLKQLDEEQSMAIDLADRFANTDSKVFDSDNKLDYAATLKKMLDNGEINERELEVMRKYKSQISPPQLKKPKTEAELEAERELLLEGIDESTDFSVSELALPYARDLAKQFKKLIQTDAINKFDNVELKNVLKLIDNINNGYAPHLIQRYNEKLESITKASGLATSINTAKPLTFSAMYARVKALITGKDSIQELVRRNPLFYIDQVFGDFKTKNIFNAVFGEASKAVTKYRSEFDVIQEKINEAGANVLKSLGSDPNKFSKSKYKQMAYMIQEEYLSNPDSEQVNPVTEFLKATIERINEQNTRYTKGDSDMLQDILDTYTNDQGEFDNQALFDSFNKAEKQSIQTVRDINDSLGEKAEIAATLIRGEKYNPLDNYVHLNVLPPGNKNSLESSQLSVIKAYNTSRKPSTKAKTLIKRTGDVSPLNFDIYASAIRGSKNTLIDFHLTAPLRTARGTLNQTKKLLKEQGKYTFDNVRVFNAIESGFEESTENLLVNMFGESSAADAALNYLQKTGYRSILAGTGRFIAEYVSNVSFAMIVDPKGFIAGSKMGWLSSPKGAQVLNNLSSKQTTRIYADGLTGRFIDKSILDQAAGVRGGAAVAPVQNEILKMWNKTGQRWKNGVEAAADFLISTPDKAVMRPLWFGAFENEFKRITGKSPDFDKIADNDSTYIQANQSALDEATNLADKKSVMAGATDNAFMGILKGTAKPNQSARLRAFNAFNNFMTRFLIFEYITARTGVANLIGKGELSKKQGGRLIGAVISRMMLYTILGQLLAEGMTSLINDDDDDELPGEGMKSPEKMLGQAFASTFTSLLLGRDFGNATKLIINRGVEEFNEAQLEFLRDGEYDAFKDALQYTPLPKTASGRGNDLGDFLKGMGAAYGPVIGAGSLLIKKLTEDKKKTPEAIERQDMERFIRLPLELLGNLGFIPLYKDVRKITLDRIYGDLSRAKRELKDKQKAKKEMLQGYDSESDMKRYDRELWNATFGPNSPGYDEKQALKEIERAQRQIKQQQKDEMYNYTPPQKRKKVKQKSRFNKKKSSRFNKKKSSRFNN